MYSRRLSGWGLVLTTESEGPLVFWIGNLSDELMEPVRFWWKFLFANIPEAQLTEYPFHCTLKYFKYAIQPDLEEWLSQQPKQVLLSSGCIILGPQGAAMKITKMSTLVRHMTSKEASHMWLWWLWTETFSSSDGRIRRCHLFSNERQSSYLGK